MADVKLTAKTELAEAPATTDIFYVVDDPSGTPAGKKITAENLLKVVANFTELSAAPATSDELYILDGGVAKRISVANLLNKTLDGTINFVIDGGGSAITTGVKGFIQVDFACTINSVTLLADQSGSIVVDIWKDTYANYPPTDADSITASAVPTISSATKSQDATLTGWTTTLAAGDILGFNVDSATTVERVTLALDITRTL